MKRLDLDEERLASLYLSGKTLSEIAFLVGASASTVGQRLRPLGVLRKGGPRPNHFEPTPRFLELMDGLLLGDGHLALHGAMNTPIYSQRQCKRQEAWLCWIVDQLGLDYRWYDTDDSVQIASLAYAELGPIRDRWYPEGKKIVPSDLRLTSLSLAQWYFGDGGREGNGISFSTHGFRRKDVEFLRDCLKRDFGWTSRVNKGPRLIMGKLHEANELRSLVRPFDPGCFAYKCEEVEPHSARRFTVSEVRQIKRELGRGDRLTDVAKKRSVSVSRIGEIKYGRNFAWVEI